MRLLCAESRWNAVIATPGLTDAWLLVNRAIAGHKLIDQL